MAYIYILLLIKALCVGVLNDTKSYVGVLNNTKVMIANTLLKTVFCDFLKIKKMDLSLFTIQAATCHHLRNVIQMALKCLFCFFLKKLQELPSSWVRSQAPIVVACSLTHNLHN